MHFTHLQSILSVVGGGAVFGSTAQTSGAIQAIAAGLVPTGLTPVSFFPPSPTQRIPALSVIFLEAPLKKRKKRFTQKGSLELYLNYQKVCPYGCTFLEPFFPVIIFDKLVLSILIKKILGCGLIHRHSFWTQSRFTRKTCEDLPISFEEESSRKFSSLENFPLNHQTTLI